MTDSYITTDGSAATIDLDDLMVFPEEWRQMDVDALLKMCRNAAGTILFYMQYEQKLNWGAQARRVERLLWQLADNKRDHLWRYEDTPENRHWFMKWMFRFGDETENMC